MKKCIVMGQTTDIGGRGTTMGNPLIKKVKALPGCNAMVRRDQEVAVVWYHRSQDRPGGDSSVVLQVAA